MKPCDCKDMMDVVIGLSSDSLVHYNWRIVVAPPNIKIENPLCTIRIAQVTFKRFAEWYLEDQKRTKRHDQP